MIPGFLLIDVYGFRLYELLIAVAVFFITLTISKVFVTLLKREIHKMSKKTKTEIDDVIAKMISIFGWPFYILIAFYATLHAVSVPEYVRTWFGYLTVIVTAYYATRAVNTALDEVVTLIVKNKKRRGEKVDRTILDFFAKILKGIVIAIAILFALSGLGYNVTGIAAGLGIGGIAVAFAVQNILSDLFSALSIYLDRPFELGDFITFGDVSGTVKKIGIMTTRLTSLQGEEVVVSNNDLLATRVHNYGRLKERRVVFKIGIEYGTPLVKVKKVKRIVQDVFKKLDGVRLDRVHFTELGDYSLNFEIVYYVLSPDYVDYLNVQEKINMELMKRLEKEKINLAYPTQTVFVKK